MSDKKRKKIIRIMSIILAGLMVLGCMTALFANLI